MTAISFQHGTLRLRTITESECRYSLVAIEQLDEQANFRVRPAHDAFGQMSRSKLMPREACFSLAASASTIGHWHLAPAIVESLRQPQRATHTPVGPSKSTQTAVPVDSPLPEQDANGIAKQHQQTTRIALDSYCLSGSGGGGYVRFMVTPVSEPGGFAGPPDANAKPLGSVISSNFPLRLCIAERLPPPPGDRGKPFSSWRHREFITRRARFSHFT